MSKRRARHDRQYHGPHGAGGQRVYRCGAGHREPQAVQAQQKQTERKPGIANMQDGHDWRRRRAQAAPAQQPDGLKPSRQDQETPAKRNIRGRGPGQ